MWCTGSDIILWIIITLSYNLKILLSVANHLQWIIPPPPRRSFSQIFCDNATGNRIKHLEKILLISTEVIHIKSIKRRRKSTLIINNWNALKINNFLISKLSFWRAFPMSSVLAKKIYHWVKRTIHLHGVERSNKIMTVNTNYFCRISKNWHWEYIVLVNYFFEINPNSLLFYLTMSFNN